MHITSAMREQFLDQGYLVVENVVPQGACDDVIQAICEFENLNLDDPASWYEKDRAGHGIIPLHHHQALWNIRQLPSLHAVFSQLYQEEKLWVSMDRVSFKPAWNELCSGWQRSAVHWDCDPWHFDRLSIQGLVYLTDTEMDQGPFACVPKIYQNLTGYLREHEEDENRRRPIYGALDLIPVPAPAGALVLFNRLMPHTSLLNKSQDTRFVQYVAMDQIPADHYEVLRAERIEEWKERIPPQWAINQKVAGQQIPEPGPAAELSELGRKLAGIDEWI